LWGNVLEYQNVFLSYLKEATHIPHRATAFYYIRSLSNILAMKTRENSITEIWKSYCNKGSSNTDSTFECLMNTINAKV